jgi:hypothetical protein
MSTWKLVILTAIYIALCAVGLLIGLAALTLEAGAHSWYSERQDPVWRNSCCGGTDCHEIDAKYIRVGNRGYRITLTVEQARQVNPFATKAIDADIEMERVQMSEDGQYHICLMAYWNPDDKRQGVFCFFAPPGI